MKFVYELRENYDERLSESNLSERAFKEILCIYKLLVRLDKDIISNISEIYFLAESSFHWQQKFIDVLKVFNPDLESFDDTSQGDGNKINVMEFWEMFPTKRELEENHNHERSMRLLENVILKDFKDISEIVKTFSKRNGSEQCMIFLSFCGEQTMRIVKEVPPEKLFLISDYLRERQGTKDNLVEVEPQKFIEIYSLLSEAKEKYTSHKAMFSELRNYTHPGLIEAIEGEYDLKLEEAFRSPKKRITVNGEDIYLAKRVTNQLVLADCPVYYDLDNSWPLHVGDQYPIVMFHVDKVAAEKLRELSLLIGPFECAREIKSSPEENKNEFNGQKPRKHYLILQGENVYRIYYFSDYTYIILPEYAFIQKYITKIFLSMLLEMRCLQSSNELLKINATGCFDQLLEDVASLDNLHNSLEKFSSVNMDDLLNSPEFWYFLKEELQRLQAQSPIAHRAIPKDELSIKRAGKGWEVTINRNSLVKLKNKMGILYYVFTIILCQETNGVSMKTLREVVDCYGKGVKYKENNDYTGSKGNRDTIDNALKRMENESISEYIRSNLLIESGTNMISLKNVNKIMCIIEDGDFKLKYLPKAYSSEQYKEKLRKIIINNPDL